MLNPCWGEIQMQKNIYLPSKWFILQRVDIIPFLQVFRPGFCGDQRILPSSGAGAFECRSPWTGPRHSSTAGIHHASRLTCPCGEYCVWTRFIPYLLVQGARSSWAMILTISDRQVLVFCVLRLTKQLQPFSGHIVMLQHSCCVWQI